jgi:sugar phosphate isomerase/epimerase
MKLGCSSLTTRLYYQLTESDTSYKPVRHTVDANPKIIARTIRRVSELGLPLLDLSVNSIEHLQLLLAQDGARKIAESCRDRSVEIDHIFFDFLHRWIFDPIPEGRVEHAWSQIASLSAALDASMVEMLSPPLSIFSEESDLSWDDAWLAFVRSIESYNEIATKHGLKLAIEARPREFLNGTDSLLRLFDTVSSPNLGGIVDISHLDFVREIPAVAIRKLGKKVFTVHLSDNDGVTEFHWAPGQGRIDWQSVFDALRKIDYGGELSLDVSGMDVEREVTEGMQYVKPFLNVGKRPRVLAAVKERGGGSR